MPQKVLRLFTRAQRKEPSSSVRPSRPHANNSFALDIEKSENDTVHAQAPEIGVLRPGRSHIQAVLAEMVEREEDIGLLSAVLCTFWVPSVQLQKSLSPSAQNRKRFRDSYNVFVKNFSFRKKSCENFLAVL